MPKSEDVVGWGDSRLEAMNEMVRELIQIGRGPGFLEPCAEDYEEGGYFNGTPFPTFPEGTFDEKNQNIRAREIGENLDKLGGMRLMQVAHAAVARAVPEQARHLEFCWSWIGQWQP